MTKKSTQQVDENEYLFIDKNTTDLMKKVVKKSSRKKKGEKRIVEI